MGTALFAQTQNDKDTIKVNYSFFGNSYFYQNKTYSKGEISDILEKNTKSDNLLSSYNLNITIAYIALPAGILLTGASLYAVWINQDSYGRSPQDNYGRFPTNTAFLALAGTTVAVDLLSIFCFLHANSQFRRSVAAYNKSIKSNTTGYDSELKLNLAFNRLILTYNF